MAAEFAPEVIFHIGSFPVTNTILNTVFVDSIIIGGLVYLNRNFKKIPGMFQNTLELLVDGFYNLNETIAGKNTKKIFPWFMSFFIFILLTNLTGLIPGTGSIWIEDHGHKLYLFRNGTSDLNLTLALTIISLFATHFYSITTIGVKDYFGRYFSLNPVNLFVGVLEIVGEFTKLISLSFRLFGNIFAGEVLLATIGSIFAFILPIPFMLLEIIVGLVQAMVFSMLTMVFMSMLMTPHSEAAHS
jgi:F-type H+-transporting ATPase subunit a